MEELCSQYYSLLCAQCPVIRPFLSPRLPPNVPSTIFNVSSHKNQWRNCEYCSYETDQIVLRSEWIPNFLKHSLKLNDVKACCPRCAAILDMDSFLELSLCDPQQDDGEKLSELRTLITHFAKVNGLSTSSKDKKKEDQEKRKGKGKEDESTFSQDSYYIQQSYSLAFSLKIALSNLPGLIILDNEGNAFGEETTETDYSNLIRKLVSKKSHSHQNNNLQQNEIKEIKGKKRDRTQIESVNNKTTKKQSRSPKINHENEIENENENENENPNENDTGKENEGDSTEDLKGNENIESKKKRKNPKNQKKKKTNRSSPVS